MWNRLRKRPADPPASRCAQHEVDHLGEGAIHQLEVALEVKIVGEIELADTGGIAAAPQILEQQSVVEIGAAGHPVPAAPPDENLSSNSGCSALWVDPPSCPGHD
jgi:hypothetical protein